MNSNDYALIIYIIFSNIHKLLRSDHQISREFGILLMKF